MPLGRLPSTTSTASRSATTFRHVWLGIGAAVAMLGLSVVAEAQAGKPGTDDGESADVAGEPADQGTSREDVEKARGHFQHGVTLYADGDLGGALVEFERAYALQPSYRLLFNLAQVSAELLDYVQAERYFVRYLEEGGADVDPERRIEVEAELQQLRQRIGTVTVETSETGAEIFIDDVSVGHSPLEALPISAGQRRVRVQRRGFEPVTRVVNVIGGETQRVRIDLTPTPILMPNMDLDSASGTNQPALWAGIATGSLVLATAGMALWTYKADSDYDETLQSRSGTTKARLDTLRDRTETRALITDILLGATVVSGIVTAVLIATEGEDSETVATTPGVRLGLGSVRGTF